MYNKLCGARLGAATALAAWCCISWSAELTEREAIVRALARPAYIEIETGRLAAARGALTEASRLPNPVVSFEQERMPVAGGRSTERTAAISQSIDLSGRRSLRVEAAGQRVEVARYEALDRRVQAVAEVRRAFAESLHRDRQRLALDAWLKRIEAASATVNRLARSGEVSGYAGRRIEREVHAARARLSGAAGDAARAREHLGGLVGLEGAADLRPAGELLPGEVPPLPAALASLRKRPDLAALLAQAEAYERERKLAERTWVPDVTVGVGQKRVDEPFRNDTGVVLSLAFPLPLFDRGEGRRDTAAAQARAVRGEHALLIARSEAELRGVWSQASELRAGANALRAIPPNDLSRIAETAYRAGEGGILELLDAYRSELDAVLAVLDLELRARLARVELDAFSGADGEN